MTVGELIAFLSGCNQEARLWVKDPYLGQITLLSTITIEHNRIILSGEKTEVTRI